MTPEQRKHYFKGGKFIAIYGPVKLDIAWESKMMIGKKIEVYQNCLNTPMENGQFRFNSPAIYGWFPEEDIKDLEIIDEFIDFPEPTTQYCYRMTLTDPVAIFKNFGKGNWGKKVITTREYNTDQDDYVLNKLLDPMPDTIEKRILDLTVPENEYPAWEEIYPPKIKSNIKLEDINEQAN